MILSLEMIKGQDEYSVQEHGVYLMDLQKIGLKASINACITEVLSGICQEQASQHEQKVWTLETELTSSHDQSIRWSSEHTTL